MNISDPQSETKGGIYHWYFGDDDYEQCRVDPPHTLIYK